jgi:glycosyltransferase involved in cell wall biosynthesis
VKVFVTSPVWSLNGVNVFCAHLVRGMIHRGIDAQLLITGVAYRERKPLPLDPDLRAIHLAMPAWATWPRRRRALASFLESESPCIYLPNHDFAHSSMTGSLSPSVGVVGIVHSDDPQHYDHAARMSATWNAGVAVSQTIARRLTMTDRSRIATIPYGVRHRTEPRRQRQAGAPIRLLYAGRLEGEQKRVGDLLAIASRLKDRGVQFRLTVMGDGPEGDNLTRGITARGLDTHVEMTGIRSHDEVRLACGSHDAFILPSRFEGLPLSLLEAMGEGCIPVVTAVESGIPEVVENGVNGFAVPVGAIDEFADRIISLAASRDLSDRLSLAAWGTIVEGRFRLDTMVAAYVTLFEKVWVEVNQRRFRRSGQEVPVRMGWRERAAAPIAPFTRAVRAEQQRIAR